MRALGRLRAGILGLVVALLPPLVHGHPRARKSTQAEVVGEVLRFGIERPNRDVRGVLEDPDGVLWAVDGKGAFAVKAPRSESWRDFYPGRDGMPEGNPQGLIGFGGALWVSTPFSGLLVHAAGTWSRRGAEQGLASDLVRAMEVYSGRLYVATQRGVDMFEPGAARPSPLEFESEIQGSPSALAGGPDGLLVGTNRGELLRLSGGKIRSLGMDAALRGRPVRSLVRHGDLVWIGTFGGLLRLEPGRQELEPLEKEDPELANLVVTDMVVRGGELWVATLGAGLLRRTAAGWAQYVPPYSPLPSDEVHDLSQSPGGDLLAATSRGLARISFERVKTIDVAVRIPKTDVPTETDLSRPLPKPRQILHTQAMGSEMSPMAALGDILFEDPTILGEKAQRMGISCGSCHPAGHVNTNLFIAGISKVRGGADLSNKHFAAAGDDGIFNPVDTPSLRGLRHTGPYGKTQQEGGIREFTRRVIVLEFDGPEPSPKTLDALTAYLREFDFLPTRWVRDDGSLDPAAPDPVKRGKALFEKEFPNLPGRSCAGCHRPDSYFLDGRMHDVGTGGGFDTPTLRNVNYSPPYMHDGRFASLKDVIEHFDRTYGLGLSAREKADLLGYLEAVGEGIDPYDPE